MKSVLVLLVYWFLISTAFASDSCFDISGKYTIASNKERIRFPPPKMSQPSYGYTIYQTDCIEIDILYSYFFDYPRKEQVVNKSFTISKKFSDLNWDTVNKKLSYQTALLETSDVPILASVEDVKTFVTIYQISDGLIFEYEKSEKVKYLGISFWAFISKATGRFKLEKIN